MKLTLVDHILLETRELLVDGEQVTIGRGGACIVRLEHQGIADEHVTIFSHNGRLFLEAKAPTKIANQEQPLRQKVPLSVGDDVQLPGYSIRAALPGGNGLDVTAPIEGGVNAHDARAALSHAAPVAAPPRRAPRQAECCVLNVDMAHFARIQQAYVAHYSRRPLTAIDGSVVMVDGAAMLQNEIRRLFERGVQKACGHGVTMSSIILGQIKGDEALLRFDSAEEAHLAAVAILDEAEEHNQEYRLVVPEIRDMNMRCFRVGIAWGALEACSDGTVAGEVLSASKRLQEGGEHAAEGEYIRVRSTGEIRICPGTYQRLPKALRRLYGGAQDIPGKASDNSGGTWPGHRYRVKDAAPWENLDDETPIRENPDFPRKPVRREKCFVVSPLDPDDARVTEVYEQLIVPGCLAAGFEAQPAEKIGKSSRRTPGGDRLSAIKEQLRNAPMVVAYLGDPSAGYNINVIFEVGFRLAMQKPIVLVSESPPAGRGRSQGIDDLLPFHLKTKNVLVLPPDAPVASMAEILREEIQVARSRRRMNWKLPHAVAEVVIYGDDDKEDRLTYVSEAAERLFGVKKNDTLMRMITSLQEHMPEAQQGPFFQEQQKLIDAIEEATRRGVFMRSRQSRDIPRATVPILLPARDKKDELLGFTAHLPIIVRYSRQKGATRLRVLYLDVTSRTQKCPDGYFVCDLAGPNDYLDSGEVAAM